MSEPGAKISAGDFVARLSTLCAEAVASGLNPVPLINQFVKVHKASTSLGFHEGFLTGMISASEEKKGPKP